MKTITIRDIPPELAGEIAKRARRKKMSLNRTVIDMLTERQPAQKRTLHHDLDHLAGTWSDAEAASMAVSLKEQRAFDPEDWK